jgi:hypothetical protein
MAQTETKNDLGLLLGDGFVPQRTTAGGAAINFGASIAFSANYARQLKRGNTSLFVEFPFVAEPSNRVQSSRWPIHRIPGHDLCCTFAARGVRPQRGDLSVGLRWGIAEGSEFFGNEVRHSSRYQSTGAAQFGAGVDVRTPIRVWFPISLRGEVRDYCTATNPGFGTAVWGSGQNNVVVSGGMVLHF